MAFMRTVQMTTAMARIEHHAQSVLHLSGVITCVSALCDAGKEEKELFQVCEFILS